MGAWGAYEKGWNEAGPRYDWNDLVPRKQAEGRLPLEDVALKDGANRCHSPSIAPNSLFGPFASAPSVEPSPRWIRVKFGGGVIADSKRALLLLQYGPGRLPTYYFPPEDEGIASYWSVRIGDRVATDLVWSYPDPIAECPKIRDLLCFFNERVDLYVDGTLQPRPQTPWSP